MSTNCISGNIPQIWRLSGVTRTIRCVINDAEGEPRDLSDLTLAVVVSRDNSDFRFSPAFVIEGDDHNIVAFSWPADKQGVGDYTVEVTGVDGSGNVDRVNWHGATGIRLVDYTNEVRGDCPAIMSDEPAIGLEGEYTMNGTGMSAYDEWLAQGHTGTPEDFLAWLRQPAVDAATEAAATVDAKIAEVDAAMEAIAATAEADHTRAGSDHTTATGDHTRAEADHAQAVADSQQAATDHQQAESDAAAAASDREKAATDRTKAANDRQQAAADHGLAATDHATAASDHTTAASDHTKAVQDSTRAGSDHDIAVADHAQAEADHTQAGQDHTQAGNDHTRAEADHGIAADDHTQAEQDHTQALSDHETWADKADTDGYYERMGVGTAKNLEGVVSQSAEIIFRKTGGSASVDSGLATMSSIKGNTLVWNQLVQNGNFENGTTGFATYRATASVSDKELTLTISSGNTAGCLYKDIIVVSGHKYLCFLNAKKGSATRASLETQKASSKTVYTTSETYEKLSVIITAAENKTELRVLCWAAGEAGENASFRNLCVFDLTLMFGAGNEPSTVAEFEAMYPLPYYDYNAGEIVSNKATALETVGFNQWDEEWEQGAINNTTGANLSENNRIRSKNYIPVISGQTYYCYYGNDSSSTHLYVYWYDANKNYLVTVSVGNKQSGGRISGSSFVIPPEVRYIRFCSYGGTLNLYNHDICINLSNPAKNGTYQPYEKHTLTLNLPTLTGKLNGEGTSVTIAPDGLKSAGTAYDYGVVENGYLTKIVKCVGDVDMGDLTWNNVDAANGRYYAVISDAKGYNDNTVCCVSPLYTYKYMSYETSYDMTMQLRTNQRLYLRNSAYTTASSFDTAMTGVPLYYQLAEPQTYVLDNPVYVGYLEDGGGTERRLPEDTASSVLAPLACDVTYPMDAVGAIEKMPENYISKESMQAYLAARASLDNGTWTMTWNAAAGKYNFTFTPNA